MARIKPQTLLLQSKKKKGPTRISLTTIIFCNLIVILLVLSLVSTYRYYTQRSRTLAQNVFMDLAEDGLTESGRLQVPNYAILETSKGSITVELFKEASPEILNKFIKMCKKGHFKGLPFHRVIKNYIIKAGDYQRLGPEEDWILKVKPQNQLVMSSKHEAFMIGTSKATRSNKGFDIFITTAPIPDLNDKLVVFGQVIKGEDVVQEIEEVDTDKDYRPKSNIGILNINLKQET
ncbi:peptidylprolyl isomerase [Ranunculus cassubicifolius]